MVDLKKIITNAWTDTVKNFYKNHRIHNEFSLQSVVYHGLYKHGLDKDYTVYVESSWCFEDSGEKLDKFPDIVITHKQKIVCVIEIKCTPHANLREKWLKDDLDKLVLYYEFSELEHNGSEKKITLHSFGPNRILNKPFYADESKIKYTFDKNTIFTFASIAMKNSISDEIETLLKYAEDKNIKLGKIKNFMLLTGVIKYPDGESKQQTNTFNVYQKP